MVPLPLFKIATLFVRHVSKYGANHIKHQAHEHPRFRAFAARYGQVIHQINMRLSVALLRNPDLEQRAKEKAEKAEAPTVKTEEQVKKEEELRAKYGTLPKTSHPVKEVPKSVWKRKFRPLPEAKAVDLFADVIGDTFILSVAIGLIVYEYWRSSQKPDKNKEMIEELQKRMEELRTKEEELEAVEKKQQERVAMIEEALRAFKDPKTKQPLLPTPTAAT
ncbi:optic atrophy 3-like protein [Chaetomium strumarium]|uniref:Optic atrophy 3-like protein n=1 Tax=Chaetomium strumarium TaxID=1170767 RepID=A0AAJ0M5R0_9PEZI|nr:optic atrophy 3-like protein [Chaetomium strumarium]